ncbi:hypothetical protein M5K25_024504 [Dendrobium thyrsiflorum]|uniref:Uncharacterized protein n=1 Tax=Dendrobium thyrsiflorum TaxID=117978 RepID=A0ABD0U2F4_DENTH
MLFGFTPSGVVSKGIVAEDGGTSVHLVDDLGSSWTLLVDKSKSEYEFIIVLDRLDEQFTVFELIVQDEPNYHRTTLNAWIVQDKHIRFDLLIHIHFQFSNVSFNLEKMTSSSKRSRISKGSTSSSRNKNFLSKENETILPLFSSTQSSFILTLTHSYHKEMFFQFLSNLRFIPDSTRMTSFVMQQKVTINKEDLGTFIHLRTKGDRLHRLIQDSDINKYHQPRVYTLHQNARIIQHVLRSCIIPKVGDRVNMTHLLSLVTHLIMSNKPFDEAQLIIDYIRSLTDIRHPQTKRKKNIALGHLVCYIFEKKYNLIYPEPPTEEPIFFTNASFRSLFHDPPAEGEDLEGERVVPPEPAPAPNQNAYQDMIQRFDTMEVNFGKRFNQIELHMKTQEKRHNLDMAWIRGQKDYINQNVAMINSYFTAFNPQPPPDQDPGM